MPCHRIDGKVPARQVVFNAGGSLHILGVTAIRIESVQTVCRDLNALSADDGSDAPEFDARLDY